MTGPGQPAGEALVRPDEAAVLAELRGLLAGVTGRDELRGIPAGSALFGPPVALDSLTGTRLLREVRQRFGVDVAAEDINLDALATLGTLATFVAGRARAGRP